ncbi:MAG: UDP-N-acetylglucosamine 1-carboxyvinyltransferase, partial [Actinomycetota bacterium]|nr:UDP-N-acetylglucosamine 1-carboxyvinyltransferase [Actinomycetota bacterium]
MKYLIKGGNRLSGKVRVSGAKNSALKIMAASIMSKGKTVLRNVPIIDDVLTMAEVLELLGASVNLDKALNCIEINPDNIKSFEAPYELVRKMRASILVAGPLLSRFGEVKVAIPGGCNIGSRQIDMHLKGFEQMGAHSTTEHGYVYIKANSAQIKSQRKRLKGSNINLDFPSRGATENILMAASLASGSTTIYNAAKEPETSDLAKYLIKCGADITGVDSDCLVINGVDEL